MKNLTGLTVLVTRPKPQGEELCGLIQQAHGQPIFFPTLEICPTENKTDLAKKIKKLDQFDWLIFVSAHAVLHSAALIHSIWPVLPQHIKIAAIGESTAKMLKTMGLPVHISPKTNWNSEGLLALAEFQRVAGKKIALVRGEGGRELLSHLLIARGAILTDMVAYRRRLPVLDVALYSYLIRTHQINVVISTSGESLQNLKTLFKEHCWDDLCKIPLVVISQRLESLAIKLGFTTCLLAKNATHHAIIEILLQNKEILCRMTQKKK
jgi:uroporphyrinogen-III synthase